MSLQAESQRHDSQDSIDSFYSAQSESEELRYDGAEAQRNGDKLRDPIPTAGLSTEEEPRRSSVSRGSPVKLAGIRKQDPKSDRPGNGHSTRDPGSLKGPALVLPEPPPSAPASLSSSSRSKWHIFGSLKQDSPPSSPGAKTSIKHGPVSASALTGWRGKDKAASGARKGPSKRARHGGASSHLPAEQASATSSQKSGANGARSPSLSPPPAPLRRNQTGGKSTGSPTRVEKQPSHAASIDTANLNSEQGQNQHMLKPLGTLQGPAGSESPADDDWGDDFGSELDDGLAGNALDTTFSSFSERRNTQQSGRRGGDGLKLRAFDDIGGQGEDMEVSDAPVSRVIGIYADPTAEKDDWGDDFQLDAEDTLHQKAPATDSQNVKENMTTVLELLLRKSKKESSSTLSEDEFHSIDEESDGHQEEARPLYQDWTESTRDGGPDVGRLGVVPAADVQVAPDHLSINEDIGYGYEAGEIHPNCISFLEVCKRQRPAIEAHLEGLRANRSNFQALERSAELVYSLTSDTDVAALRGGGAADIVGKDVLLWKYEYACLRKDTISTVCTMIGLARYEREARDMDKAFEWLDKARAELESSRISGEEIDTLRIEVQFELGLAHFAAGDLKTAALTFHRASDIGMELATRDDAAGASQGAEQRGRWWALQCKFMVGEVLYAQDEYSDALQYYIGYSVWAIARMIGLSVPEFPEQATVGTLLMKHCLFLPRRLCLSIWNSALCLARMGAIDQAADVGGMAMRAATALGIEDLRRVTAEFCGRVALTLKEAHVQQGAEATGSDDYNDGATSAMTDADGDFNEGEFEDWDAEIERELNIKLQRCSDVTASYGVSLFAKGLAGHHHTGAHIAGSSIAENGNIRPSDAGAEIRQGLSSVESGRRRDSPVVRNFVESQLVEYLQRLTSPAVTISSQQMMYPRPTEVFRGQTLGPKEHELFLQRFVAHPAAEPAGERNGAATRSHAGASRSARNAEARKGLHSTRARVSSSPLESFPRDYQSRITRVLVAANEGDLSRTSGSSKFLALHIELLWSSLRSEQDGLRRREHVRYLATSAFQQLNNGGILALAMEDGDMVARNTVIGGLLDVLRLARETLAPNGADASWFDDAVKVLSVLAASLTPTAKAYVELFRAESRAHCGLVAVTPPHTLASITLQKRATSRGGNVSPNSTSKIPRVSSSGAHGQVPPELDQSIVDVLHALYWRTKASVDINLAADAIERIVHANVAASLYLVGSGLSPLTGQPLDIDKDEELLQLDARRASLVDDTPRVGGEELVANLRVMWKALPDSAADIRGKICFALGHYNKETSRDLVYAERIIFDGLIGLDRFRAAPRGVHALFGMAYAVAPVALVASRLSVALLRAYGAVALQRAKYRYGIAALEAAVEAERILDPDGRAAWATAQEIAAVALSRYDWRRALLWLYDVRDNSHPKDGRRNDFLQLCLSLYSICSDAGFFDAAEVPLRSCAALIYEERLRTLLQQYREKIAKKARKKRRYEAAISILPPLAPNSRTPARRAAFSPFYDTPLHMRFAGAGDGSGGDTLNPVDGLYTERRSSALVPASSSRTTGWSLRTARYVLGLGNRAGRPSSQQKGGSGSPREATGGISGSRTRQRPRRGMEAESSGLQSDSHTDLSQVDSDTTDTGGPRAHNASEKSNNFGQDEKDELLRIAEEQEAAANVERFEIDLRRAQLAFDRGAYAEADELCRTMLEMELPSHISRYYVSEIMAKVRLKRREITRCLEIVDQMEIEALRASALQMRGLTPDRHAVSGGDSFGVSSTASAEGSEGVRSTSFRSNGHSDEVDFGAPLFLPEAACLRLSALRHGGRLSEALTYADEVIAQCPEALIWNRARLHYLRGKVLFAMCSSATAPFDSDQTSAAHSAGVETDINAQFVELALSAFETARGFFEAAGDEVSMVKADLRWALTAVDPLLRSVIVPVDPSCRMALADACRLNNRFISTTDVEEIVYSAISFLSETNHPLLLINAITTLGEIKCVHGEPSESFSSWISEAWKLFSRLFTDPEEYKVVVSSVAPVSVLMRLRSLCGRLVRLIMCSTHRADVETMNRDLAIFEVYVSLQIDIDRRMNLASSVHAGVSLNGTSDGIDGADGAPEAGGEEPRSGRTETTGESENSEGHSERRQMDTRSGAPSATATNPATSSDRPAGAFLHILGDEGLALGKQGLTVFFNKPRQQVVTAVRETGAVLLPNALVSPQSGRRRASSGRDRQEAEYVFPYDQRFGLGPMYILHGATYEVTGSRVSRSQRAPIVHDNDLSTPHVRPGDAGIEPQHYGGTPDSARDKASDMVRRNSHMYGGAIGGDSNAGQQEQDPLHSATPEQPLPIDTNTIGSQRRSGDPSNPLVQLVNTVRRSLEGSVAENEYAEIPGAWRVWAHMHRLKTETRRYSQGSISKEELGVRNGATLRSWLSCMPRSKREWSVPDVLAKRLVYILNAHGVVGYYSVERGGCVSRVEFGGKQQSHDRASRSRYPSDSGTIEPTTRHLQRLMPRPPNDSERKYLYGLVKESKATGSAWYKDREFEIVNGLANQVLQTPRILLDTRSSAARKVQKNRPVVLVADLSLQVIPWELFLDHVVIRSPTLLDAIRGLQREALHNHGQQAVQEAMLYPTVAASRRVARFVVFQSSRREAGGDLERSEEARRKQLAFQALLRLNHMSPHRLISRLELGGFSDPTALNAVARPTGPLSTPLTQNKRAVRVLGVRLEASLGRRNFANLDFLKVAGLGSASTFDLREATRLPLQKAMADRTLPPDLDVGAYITVFLFTYADLVDLTESVFGLTRAAPRGILLFAPATKLKIVARHLEDDELEEELQQASGRKAGRIVPDISASAYVIVDYVSRFARSKLIPIVTILGEGLVDIFPRKNTRRAGTSRRGARKSAR